MTGVQVRITRPKQSDEYCHPHGNMGYSIAIAD